MSRPATPDYTDAYTERDYRTLLRHVYGWAQHPDPRMGPMPTASQLYRDLTTYHHVSPRAALEAYAAASGRDIVRLPAADTTHVAPRTEWGLRAIIVAENAKPSAERNGALMDMVRDLIREVDSE